MPRILTPNTSFQRRGSRTSSRALSWHGYSAGSYRSGSKKTLVVRPQETRNSFGDSSSTAETLNSMHCWQFQNESSNTCDFSASLSTPLRSPSAGRQQIPPNARYPVVSRRGRIPTEQTLSRPTARPSTYPKEEEWGQFVDVADEEEKLIRLLSRSRA